MQTILLIKIKLFTKRKLKRLKKYFKLIDFNIWYFFTDMTKLKAQHPQWSEIEKIVQKYILGENLEVQKFLSIFFILIVLIALL